MFTFLNGYNNKVILNPVQFLVRRPYWSDVAIVVRVALVYIYSIEK